MTFTLYKLGTRIYTPLGIGTVRALNTETIVVEVDKYGTRTFLYRDVNNEVEEVKPE